MNCDLCGDPVADSIKKDYTDPCGLVVKDVATYLCRGCGIEWLPAGQEHLIDAAVARHLRDRVQQLETIARCADLVLSQCARPLSSRQAHLARELKRAGIGIDHTL